MICKYKFEIPEKTLLAIRKGIKRGDAVVEMELMGLPQRVINALEDSDFQIIYLEKLVNHTLEQLLTISNIGEKAIKQLIEILSNYDKLDKMIESNL